MQESGASPGSTLTYVARATTAGTFVRPSRARGCGWRTRRVRCSRARSTQLPCPALCGGERAV